MSESPENHLWPPEGERPSLEVYLGADRYNLTWQNTCVKVYRTGEEKFDKGLRQYTHVLHRYSEGDTMADHIVLSFEQIGPAGVDYLLQNGYPYHVIPIPEDYIIQVRVSMEVSNWPEAIGPEFES